jgi:hypothetical protein
MNLIKSLLTALFLISCGYVYAAGCDANTHLLIHFDEADTSTTIAETDCDSSGAKTITANGDVQTDSGVTKFGNTSLFDGTGDYWTLADSADWDMFASSSGDWTVDVWIKHANTSVSQVFIAHSEGNAKQWFIRDEFGFSGKLELRVLDNSDAGTTELAMDCTGLSDTDWHHVVVGKVGSEYGLYTDEAQCEYASTTNTLDATGLLYIGRRIDSGDPMHMNGSMDEVHIQNSNHLSLSPQSDDSDTYTAPTVAYSAAAGSTRNRLITYRREFRKLPTGGYERIVTKYNFIPKGWIDEETNALRADVKHLNRS